MNKEPKGIWASKTNVSQVLLFSDIMLSIAQLAPVMAVLAVAVFYGTGQPLWPAAVIFISLISVGFLDDWIYFRYIKCPHCGYNPTRTKEGKRKKLARTAIRASIDKMTECPECHQ